MNYRRLIEISGLVQGVGFRPFVFQLASKHRVFGNVRNTLGGVSIEAQADEVVLDTFLLELRNKAPEASHIQSIAISELAPKEEDKFRIEESSTDHTNTTSMPHDRAPCRKCLQEFYDKGNHRYRYPFITCNNCGPRFTIAEALPFDRHNTTMRSFVLCSSCRSEYSDPTNRRFHAQTVSCPKCGPQLVFKTGESAFVEEAALSKTIDLIKKGGLVAVKGVGGYQLICSALAQDSIARIRRFKTRKLKPFAVMAPNTSEVESLCHVSSSEKELLCCPVAPVVLLYVKNRDNFIKKIHGDIAPSLSTLGIMLPPSPLHHLLVQESGSWLVVTSANRRGEPMHYINDEVTEELNDVVDGILHHNRQILHLADDSVIRFADKQMIVLRHARGLAPSEVSFDHEKFCGLGIGGHTKSAFALALENRFILSQHIGDLDSRRACDVLMREVKSFEKIYKADERIAQIACDAHSAYSSTKLAAKCRNDYQTVLHHEAHLESLIAEHGFSGRALGVVCDGTGIGEDGTIWGGEFFLVDGNQRKRIGSLLPFRLPGGDSAVKEPRRSALGMIYETYGDAASTHPLVTSSFRGDEVSLLFPAMKRNINTPQTSSLGRLFDGFAALSGLLSIADYEAQAPLALEALAHEITEINPFPVVWKLDTKGIWRWDWRNLVTFATEARSSHIARSKFSAAFHATIVQASHELAEKHDVNTLLLTGGVFQNAYLVSRFQQRSSSKLFVITHNRIPPGDGGLALGQIAAVRQRGKNNVSRHSR